MPLTDPEKRRAYEQKRSQDPARKQAKRDRINRWKREHPERLKASRRKAILKHRYGMTPETYRAMWELQRGLCANGACIRSAEYIDYDHATGKVRALLCKQCNFALGMIDDTPAIAQGLIDYLKRFSYANPN